MNFYVFSDLLGKSDDNLFFSLLLVKPPRPGHVVPHSRLSYRQHAKVGRENPGLKLMPPQETWDTEGSQVEYRRFWLYFNIFMVIQGDSRAELWTFKGGQKA